MTVHEILFELQKLWLAKTPDPDGKQRSTLIAHLSASTELSSSEIVGAEVFSGLIPAFITELLNSYASGRMSALHDNAGYGHSRTPVENICWKDLPKYEGVYKVIVNQFASRESSDLGFEVEIEFDGMIYNFNSRENGPTGRNHNIVEFTYTKKDGVVFPNANGKVSSYPSKEKWGVVTGQYQKVRAITTSPNYWNAETGNKHYFFFLENCKSDEKCRPFYKEFLKDELTVDRKVFEILGSKVEVEPVEKELSGIIESLSDTNKKKQKHTPMSTTTSDELFITASRKKLRFPTSKGSVGVEDLWDLSLQSLDAVAVAIDEKVQKAGRKSFISNRRQNDYEAILQFGIVKHVIDTKLTEEDLAKTRAEKANQKAFLQTLLIQKETQKLEGLSVDEIQKKIDQLA